MHKLRLPHDGLVIRDVLFNNIIENEYKNHKQVKVLEAGCGRKWALENSSVNFHISGVDLDKKAYEIRKSRFNDIDQFYHTSLDEFIQKEKFDFIYCVDVLEHCVNTENIMYNLMESLKNNGLALVAFPNKNSLFGRITLLTPHWFHVIFYRYIFKNKNAGNSGYGPYPVVYENFLKPENFEASLKKFGNNKIEYKITREFDYRRIGLLKILYLPVMVLLKTLFGRSVSDAGLIYILRKV